MQRILLVWWANFGTDAITLDGWLLGAWTLGWVIMKDCTGWDMMRALSAGVIGRCCCCCGCSTCVLRCGLVGMMI